MRIAAALALVAVASLGCGKDKPAATAAQARPPELRLVYSIDLDRAVEERAADGTAGDPAAIRAAALKQAVAVIRERIDSRGVDGATVAAAGDQIVVELPGLDDEATLAVRSLITRTASLSFRVVDHDSAFMRRVFARVGIEDPAGDPDAAAAGITAHVDQWQPDPRSFATDYYLTAADREEDLSVSEARRLGCSHGAVGTPSVRCLVSGRRVLERYLTALAAADPALAVAGDRAIGYQRVEVEGQRPTWRTYYLERTARLGGADVAGAQAVPAQPDGRMEILVTFDARGRRELTDLTGEIVGKKLAIVLDDQVRSAPIVLGRITGGVLTITLGGTDRDRQDREAQELVDVLRNGSLPAPLVEESVTP